MSDEIMHTRQVSASEILVEFPPLTPPPRPPAQEIIIDRPPWFDVIADAFPSARKHGVIFSWGDRIYNPSGVVIPPEILAHEAIHGARQGSTEADIRGWWAEYLGDTKFRLAEELAAHQAELEYLQAHGSRQQRRAAL